MAKKLRINLNTQALVKTGSLIANAVTLSANVYLISTGLRSRLVEQKRREISDRLQLTAELAGATAGLIRVVAATLNNQKTTS